MLSRIKIGMGTQPNAVSIDFPVVLLAWPSALLPDEGLATTFGPANRRGSQVRWLCTVEGPNVNAAGSGAKPAGRRDIHGTANSLRTQGFVGSRLAVPSWARNFERRNARCNPKVRPPLAE
jgi:hypothetical protein